jgi:predicted nucleic acid-binding protein
LIVVADTSPINYLVLIDEIALLQQLYGKVLIPPAVLKELQDKRTPEKVRRWIDVAPSWFEVHPVRAIRLPLTADLDDGELEALQLAHETGADFVLMDEADGRIQAELLNLTVRGTLRVIEDGARLGLIDFRAVIDKLKKTSFRVSPSLLATFLTRNS